MGLDGITEVGEFKLTTIFSDYPNISKIEPTYTIGTKLIHNPFGNCQSFSITNYKDLNHFINKDNVTDLLKALITHTRKWQMTLDLRKEDVYKVLKKIRIFSREINIKNYINNNGSEMTIVIIKLDRDKIFSKPF